MHQAVITKTRANGDIWVLDDVDWKDYSRFLRLFEERPGYRLTYDQGTLEIMSPTLRHDKPGRFLGRMVWVLTDEFELPILAGGSTTMRRKLKMKGVEADECFWIQNAHRMAGRLNLNLRRDPPPDLGIEVDVTSSCLNRLGIYAALGVPEIWRLEGRKLEFLVLQVNGKYKRSARSLAFPRIAPADLLPFVIRARRAGDQNPIIREFRTWLQGLK